MSSKPDSPDQLFREFVRRANAGDIDGVVALYAPDAKVYFSPDKATQGHEQIRAALEAMLAGGVTLSDTGQRTSIVVGSLALTSATLGEAQFTAEVAERQADGSWLWVIDHPSFTSPDFLAAE